MLFNWQAAAVCRSRQVIGRRAAWRQDDVRGQVAMGRR